MTTETKAAAKPGPRERLLDAARKLTYTQGVGVGVDAILKQADVARRSLYQHFGGKDGLLVEVIRVAAAEDEERYRVAIEAGGTDPRARIMSVFDVLTRIVSSPDFRGCRYIAADLALTDPDHPVHAETHAYRQWLHEILRAELEGLPHPHPDRAADELLFIVEGALISGATRPEVDSGRIARRLAERVLDAG
ncbi:TetR/AcrR family transcriptional regulator [Streptosporangium sp. CA-135522]|uniref:TetR/AcrR family transcriptional regulator n=1 Tax=Streptosporangium sp. CA-135522 TaxID=3240072 RepID=UPI003D9211AA